MNPHLKKALFRVPAIRRYAFARRTGERGASPIQKTIEGWLLRTTAKDGQTHDLAAEIKAGADLSSNRIRKMTAALESEIAAFANIAPVETSGFFSILRDVRNARASTDPIAAHREIGQAIFDRDQALYVGNDLPAHLKRYTYPPYLSIHLNEHCNAACFFCREHDFKGRLLDFDQLHKLDSAFRMARVLEFTGWGEPFFYPKLDQVVDKVLALNSSPHLLSFTTNGSMLSASWGKKLSGKINRLCISINAATAPTYEAQMRYKNARFTFGYVLQHIREFMAELTPADVARMTFHMVANTDNFREIPDLVALAASLKIPTVSIGNYVCADERYLDKSLTRVKRDYNDVIAKSLEIAIGNGVNLHARKFFTNEPRVNAQATCMAPFERLYAEVPGDVAPCCFMGAHRMGNVYDAGVEAVWFSPQMQALRRSRHLPACSTCTLYNPFDEDISHLSQYLIERKEIRSREQKTG